MRLRDYVRFGKGTAVYLNGKRRRPRTRVPEGRFSFIVVVQRGREVAAVGVHPITIDMSLLPPRPVED